MDASEILNVAVPLIFAVVGIALVVVLIEAVKTLRSVRTTVEEVKKQVDPTLEHVEYITRSIRPAIDRVDPLVERVSLTVDAANLEIMRVDQILEDVTVITDSASNAAAAVDSVASVPLNAVKSASDKVRSVLKPKSVSEQTAQLEEQRRAVGRALDELKAEEAKAASRAAGESGETVPGGEPSASVQSGAKAQSPAYYTYDEQDPSRPASSAE